LVCYDFRREEPRVLRTPSATTVAGSGKWHVSNLKNPLDDTRTVALTLGATTGSRALAIRWYGRLLEPKVEFQLNVALTWRSDSEDPVPPDRKGATPPLLAPSVRATCECHRVVFFRLETCHLPDPATVVADGVREYPRLFATES